MSSKENADYLLSAAIAAGIKDPKEQANFMGQMQVECGGFGHMSEGLNYSGDRLLKIFPGRNGMHTTAQANAIANGGPETVANAIYGGEWGKKHLGNTEPGDGWKFHGRGYVQLTGREAYERIGKDIGQDLVHHPELAENREIAAKIAIQYWQDRVVPHHHQTDVTGACHDINGGENGLKERKAAASAWDEKLAHGYVPGGQGSAIQTQPASHHAHATHAGTLAQGDHGAAVGKLQGELSQLGYKDGHGHPLKTDSDFGLDTRHAVEKFQHDHGLAVDGKVGPATEKALEIQIKEHAKVPGLDNLKNPDHALYVQALAGVHKLDAQAGRASDAHSTNLAAALVVDAKKEGLTRIDTVALSTDNGSRVFAVQNGFPLQKFAEVPTLPSLNTPIGQSSAAVTQVNQQHAAAAAVKAPEAPLVQPAPEPARGHAL